MKYDDASWHYEGNFPTDLPPAAGATHIGMFVAWTILNGMAGSFLVEEFPEDLAQLRQRATTPGQFLIRTCDEKFTDEELSDEGKKFAGYYFEAADSNSKYLDDYESTLGTAGKSLYHVADTWENYDRLSPVIQKRFDHWKAGS